MIHTPILKPITNALRFYDGFENGLSNWETWGETNWSVTQSTVANMGTYSMALRNPTYGNYAASKTEGLNIIYNCIVTFDWRYATGYSNYAAYFSVIDSLSTTIISLNWGQLGLRWYNGTDWIYFFTSDVANIWYRIKLDMNLSTETYDIYVDDVLKKTGATFRSSGSSIGALQFTVGGGTSNSGLIYVDEISVI